MLEQKITRKKFITGIFSFIAVVIAGKMLKSDSTIPSFTNDNSNDSYGGIQSNNYSYGGQKNV